MTASGSIFIAPAAISMAVAAWFGQSVPALRLVQLFLLGPGLTCFYLAFSTPQWMFRRWQRSENADFLNVTSAREPEERGEKAPADLYRGVARATGGALTFVATREKSDAEEIVIRASSDPELVGLELRPGGGLVARALVECRVARGRPADCERELAQRFAKHGTTVLMAPIMSDEHLWGLSGVVHRRGALFPDDDLAMLMLLGRSAATALDHAELVVDRRERQRREHERQMRQFESRVDLMLDSIKDYGLLVLNEDGTIGGWQPGAQQVFGYDSDEVAGRSAAPLFQMSQADFEALLQVARQDGIAEREGACRRQDGSTFVGATIIRPLVDPSETSRGYVAVTNDVTNQRALEERVRQGQKMEAIGRLAGGVAHDFNNILMVVLGHADWLDRELKGDPRHTEVTGIIEAAERGAELTQRLLAFSRRNKPVLSRVNLGDRVAVNLSILSRLIDPHIRIVNATSSGVPDVFADPVQIDQVLMNLALNARDAMPEEGTLTIRTAEVWLDASTGGLPSGRYALLEVSDTGIGMDVETRKMAFEPFFTTKDVGKGTGLGLSTVYGIVHQMNGRIQIESEPGRGTTFRIYLPEYGSEATTVQPLTIDSAVGSERLM